MTGKKSKEVIKAVNDYLQSDDNAISEGYFSVYRVLNKDEDAMLFKELLQEGVLIRESSGFFPFHKSNIALEKGKTKGYKTLLKEIGKEKKKALLNKRAKMAIAIISTIGTLTAILVELLK